MAANSSLLILPYSYSSLSSHSASSSSSSTSSGTIRGEHIVTIHVQGKSNLAEQGIEQIFKEFLLRNYQNSTHPFQDYDQRLKDYFLHDWKPTNCQFSGSGSFPEQMFEFPNLPLTQQAIRYRLERARLHDCIDTINRQQAHRGDRDTLQRTISHLLLKFLDTDNSIAKCRENAENLLRAQNGQGIYQELEKLEITDRFAVLLFILEKSKYESLIEPLFFSLIDSLKKSLTSKNDHLIDRDLFELSKISRQLNSLLSKGPDLEYVRYTNTTTKEIFSLSYSYLRLCSGSEYYKTIFKAIESERRDDVKRAKSFEDSVIYGDRLLVLMHWLEYSKILFLCTNDKKEQVVQYIEKLIPELMGFIVYDDQQFLEQIESILIANLNQNTLLEISRIAIDYKLKIIYKRCLGFIANASSKSLVIGIENKHFKITKENTVQSPFLMEAFDFIVKKQPILSNYSPIRKRNLALSISSSVYERNRGKHVLFLTLSLFLIMGIPQGISMILYKYTDEINNENTFLYSLMASTTCVILWIFFRNIKNSPCLFKPHLATHNCTATLSRKLRNTSNINTVQNAASKNYIESLDFSTFDHLTDTDLLKEIQGNLKINTLTLGRNPKLSWEGYLQLTLLKELTTLHINIPDARDVGSLNKLHLQSLFHSRSPLNICYTLNDYVVDDAFVRAERMSFIRSIPNMANVDIHLMHMHLPNSYATIFEMGVWKMLSDCPRITSLIVDRIVGYKETISRISRHKNSLKALTLSVNPSEDTKNSLRKLLSGLISLEELSLRSALLDDSIIKSISDACQQLSTLKLWDIQGCSDRALDSLSTSQSLRHLTLKRMAHLTDDGVDRFLASNTTLECLEVIDCPNISIPKLIEIQRQFSIKLTEKRRQEVIEFIRPFKYITLIQFDKFFHFVLNHTKMILQSVNRGHELINALHIPQSIRENNRVSAREMLLNEALNVLPPSFSDALLTIFKRIQSGSDSEQLLACIIDLLCVDLLKISKENYISFIKSEIPRFQTEFEEVIPVILQLMKDQFRGFESRIAYLLPLIYSEKQEQTKELLIEVREHLEYGTNLIISKGETLGWNIDKNGERLRRAAFWGLALSYLDSLYPSIQVNSLYSSSTSSSTGDGTKSLFRHEEPNESKQPISINIDSSDSKRN